MKRWHIALLAGSMAALAGCFERACEPGRSIACSCASGSTGSQTCEDHGLAWAACVCTEAPRPDAGSGPDSGLPEALDAAVRDGGDDAGCEWWLDSTTPSDGWCDGGVAINCGQLGWETTTCGAGTSCRVVDVLEDANPAAPGSFGYAACVPAETCRLTWSGGFWQSALRCDPSSAAHQQVCEAIAPEGAAATGLGGPLGVWKRSPCPPSTTCGGASASCTWTGTCAMAGDSFCLASGDLVQCTSDGTQVRGEVVSCAGGEVCEDTTACSMLGRPRAACVPTFGSFVDFPSDATPTPRLVEACDRETYGGAWGTVCRGGAITRCDLFCRGTSTCRCAINPYACGGGTTCRPLASGERTCLDPALDCSSTGDGGVCATTANGAVAVQCVGGEIASRAPCGTYGLQCGLDGAAAGCFSAGTCPATPTCSGQTFTTCCGPTGTARLGVAELSCLPNRPLSVSCPPPTQCSTNGCT